MIKIVAKKGKSKKSSGASKKSSTTSKKSASKQTKKSTSQKVKPTNNNAVQYIAVAVVFVAFLLLAYVLVQNITGSDMVDEGSNQMPTGNLVAVVEGTEVYDSEIDQIIQARTQQGSQLSREDALEEIVLREVLLEEVRNRGIYPSVEETEEEITEILAQQGQSLEQFRQTLSQQGTSYESFIEDQRVGLGFERLGLSLADSEVTQEEARAFFEENSDALGEDASFEDVEQSIIDFIEQERANEALVEYGTELAEDATVEIVDQEYFNQAQQEGNNVPVVGENGSQQIEIQ